MILFKFEIIKGTSIIIEVGYKFHIHYNCIFGFVSQIGAKPHACLVSICFWRLYLYLNIWSGQCLHLNFFSCWWIYRSCLFLFPTWLKLLPHPNEQMKGFSLVCARRWSNILQMLSNTLQQSLCRHKNSFFSCFLSIFLLLQYSTSGCLN